ncbi:anthranilate phosphoribosyltransferase [Paenibacillus pectinilyticus]|uniref:Anthranilate phosphoribosyltransferase n=1 Tax=Paenibacillus pectinilyticus TaxID=512399 RepID=A0A1C1A315_9BACL|nr:anthranilate phosphoribosyltransferase [Paenibacillus pectinilyticus]OCT14945.1 anthranilate phosphoribosyltransferase [Paenibacillus pectinilyticus]
MLKQWIQAMGAEQHKMRDLTYDEAVEAANQMANGDSTDAQCAAFLMALCMKGEADEELMAFIDVYRHNSLNYRSQPNSLNSTGPTEGRKRFPITLPVSLLLASVGFTQVLHGGEALSSRQGTGVKEIVEGFGVSMQLSIKSWQSQLAQLHIGFLPTEQLCPPMGRLKQVREQLGIRTVFDTLERVLNPVLSSSVIIGVEHRKVMESLIPISMRSGFQQAYMINGIDGSEDLPLYASSTIRIVTPWGDESLVVEPQKFGFTSAPLPVLNKEEQIEMVKRIIAGEEGSAVKSERDHVIFNTGLRLKWFDKVDSYEEGFQLAESLLRRNEAHKVMQRWVDQSQQLKLQDGLDNDNSSTQIG